MKKFIISILFVFSVLLRLWQQILTMATMLADNMFRRHTEGSKFNMAIMHMAIMFQLQ